MIVVRGLSKEFRGARAFRDVSFRADEGNVLGILGMDGAGKTTLLRILAGLVAPSAGSATVAGYDVRTHAHMIREVTGYLPQTPSRYPDATVRRYLLYWALANGMGRPSAEARVSELLERLKLEESGGTDLIDATTFEQRRAYLALALLTDPRVLILDEPMAGLDSVERGVFQAHVRSLNAEGKTILIASADLPNLRPVCTRIVTMSGGLATRAFETDAILSAVGRAFHARVFVETEEEALGVVEVLRSTEGVFDVRSGPGAKVAFVDPTSFRPEELDASLRARGIPVKSIRMTEITISDIFRTLSREGVA